MGRWLCLRWCAQSECEPERNGGRLVVAASRVFAALGEQPACSVGVESKCDNYAQGVTLWNMATQYQSTP